MEHTKFRQGGFISLWLGNFADEDELDNYLEQSFPSDFGFKIYPPDGPEASVESEQTEIQTLLEGYSRSEMFLDAAVKLAALKGWNKATTAIVFYNFKYDPSFIKHEEEAKVTFIGVFEYSGF